MRRKELVTLSDASQQLLDKLESVLDSHESALRYNLTGIVRHFLWKLVLQNESNKEYGEKGTFMAHDLDTIVNTIISTSRYTERGDGEDYPIWDEKSVAPEMERVMAVLKKAGVAVEW